MCDNIQKQKNNADENQRESIIEKTEEKEEEKKTDAEEFSLKKMFIHNAVISVCVIVIMVVVFRTVFMLCYIPSSSMYNTLHINDLVIGTRFNRKDIHRYDIMVFTPPDKQDSYFIKRVIGLPGETIIVKKGNVYADGKKLKKSFVRSMNDTSGDGIYKVPEGCYFMMGDNRDDSNDSRFWIHKFVPIDNFACKAQYIAFPFNRAGSLKSKK
jgi:signal peptidase I